MKTAATLATLVLLAASIRAAELSLATAPPVVVKTSPTAGATNVDPGVTELSVTFSKPMLTTDWSWTTWSEDTFPEIRGSARYLADGRTCVLPVKLEPGRFYATWLNSDLFKNFKDTNGRPAVPYLLTFTTAGGTGAGAASGSPPPKKDGPALPRTPPMNPMPQDALLNADQKLVLQWTDRQFRSFFDARAFDAWKPEEKRELETRLIDTLKGPRSRDFYLAINSLAALKSTNALSALRDLAFDRADKDNRDRWMAIRALGILGDRESVPRLIPLLYHGNPNTRWWAQITLVRLTEQNFGQDWRAWREWWNNQGVPPVVSEDIIRWWSGQPENDQLPAWLEGGDKKFLDLLRAKL